MKITEVSLSFTVACICSARTLNDSFINLDLYIRNFWSISIVLLYSLISPLSILSKISSNSFSSFSLSITFFTSKFAVTSSIEY